MASKFTNPWLKNIETYIPGKMQEGYIKLASNENNYGASPKVVEILKDKADLIHRYPYKDAKVRQGIAKYCESYHFVQGFPRVTPKCSEKNIILGNGSDEIIDLIFKTFKSPAAGMFPTFSEYRIVSQILNKEYGEIPLNSDFSFDCGKFINNKNFQESRVIFLCSPNNPTGGVIEKKDIEKILAEGKITIVDEAYYEFCSKTCTDLIESYDNLIVLRTFAKAFALAGLRMGYAVADEKIINSLLKVKPPFNVNSLAHEAALAALSDVEFMEKNVEKIVDDREILMRKLRNKFKVFPSEANFILIDVSPLDADEFYNKLFKEKIIVRKFGKFKGFEGEYVRITIGTTDENERLIEVLDKYT